MKNDRYAIWIVIFVVLAIVFIGIGFDKMISYENPESSFSRGKNAYVGGDAYNYIINGTYATAYFVLGAASIISALLTLIVRHLGDIAQAIRGDAGNVPENKEETPLPYYQDTKKTCVNCGKSGSNLWLSKNGYCEKCAEKIMEEKKGSEEDRHASV